MNIAGVDLNLLVAFEALYQERNVSRAARRIGLAQPSLSNALSRLRHVFKDELFVRTPQGMIPTQRAEEIAPPVLAALVQMREVLAGATQFDPAKVQQSVVIAAADYFELTILPRLIRYLGEHAPGIRIRTKYLEKDQIVEQLDRREVDVAFGVIAEVPSRIQLQSAMQESFVCLLREGHPLLEKRLTLEQFLQVPHVLFSLRADARGIVDDELARMGMVRQIGLTVSHFISLGFIVKESDMIATVPQYVASVLADYLPIRIVPPPLVIPPFYLNLLWSRAMENDPLNRWLRGVILSLCKDTSSDARQK